MIDQKRLSVCAMVGVLVCAGCAQKPQHRDIIIPMPAGADRRAEAIDLTARGERAQEAGDLEAAMEYYEQATRLSADAPAAAWNNLGMIHMQRGEYVDAVAYLRTASELAPLDPQPMYNLGLTFHQAGWDRQALESFIAALEREPNYLEAIRGAVTAAMRLRLTDEDALERLEHALLVETDPRWRAIFQRERLSMETRLEALGR